MAGQTAPHGVARWHSWPDGGPSLPIALGACNTGAMGTGHSHRVPAPSIGIKLIRQVPHESVRVWRPHAWAHFSKPGLFPGHYGVGPLVATAPPESGEARGVQGQPQHAHMRTLHTMHVFCHVELEERAQSAHSDQSRHCCSANRALERRRYSKQHKHDSERDDAFLMTLGVTHTHTHTQKEGERGHSTSRVRQTR